MFDYKPEQREKFFDYLTNTFNLSEKAEVISNKIIPFNKTVAFGPKLENIYIDIVKAVGNDQIIISTNGLSAIANVELCISASANVIEEKTDAITEKIYDYCNQIAKCFLNENDGTTLTVDFSDIIGTKAYAEITNEIGTTTWCM